jgi:hypothetical protein
VTDHPNSRLYSWQTIQTIQLTDIPDNTADWYSRQYSWQTFQTIHLTDIPDYTADRHFRQYRWPELGIRYFLPFLLLANPLLQCSYSLSLLFRNLQYAIQYTLFTIRYSLFATSFEQCNRLYIPFAEKKLYFLVGWAKMYIMRTMIAFHKKYI